MPVLLAGPSSAWLNAYDPSTGKYPVEFDGPPGPFTLQSSFEAFPAGNPVTSSTALVAPGDNQWGFTSQTGGIPSVVANPVAHGARAMCCATYLGVNGGNSSAAWGAGANNNTNPFKGNFPVASQPLYFRFYVYLCGLPVASSPDIMRLAYTSASGAG